MKHLVTTDWLEKNLNNVKIFDASWHLPTSKRNSFNEFESTHIKNANFFDIDKHSDQNSNLPHMLPKKNDWEKIISEYGVENSDHIIIYDNSDVISSCRVWYNFLYFNHNPDLVSVLDGGLKKWLKEKKETTTITRKYKKSFYVTSENFNLVVNKNQIISNIKNKSFVLIDAREEKRFLGLQPELRKELKSGNIEGSKNLPYTVLINNADRTFKNKEELSSIFKSNGIDADKEIVYTCGSGVTACILGLANSIISGKKPVIYDGSWAEYGLK